MLSPKESANIITSLIKSQKTSVKTMLEECKLSKSVIDNMKTGSMPSADKMLIIANYLNVTVDYLLTGKELSNKKDLTEDEMLLLSLYNNFEDQLQKKEFIGMAINLARNIKTKNSDFTEKAQ